MEKPQTFAGGTIPRSGPRWKMRLIEGACAIIFGIVALIWPGLTLLMFVYVFGAFVIIEGLMLAISALYQRRMPMAWENATTPAPPGSWLIRFLEGLLSIAAGLICLFFPHTSVQVLLYVIAIWALFTGLAGLVHTRSRGWHAALIGVLAIIASLFIFFRTSSGAQAILWPIGVCAILAGALLIWRGWSEKQGLNVPLEPA
ncbi:MAG TPA: DUF308 domain-containing protein [Ktedonobacteraceae bacterium]